MQNPPSEYMVASTGCVMNLLYHINYANSMRKKILLYVSINAKLKACWENSEIFNNGPYIGIKDWRFYFEFSVVRHKIDIR